MARGDCVALPASQTGQGVIRGQPAAHAVTGGLRGAKWVPQSSAACSWQGCGTHQQGPTQTLGGCIITGPAAGPYGHPDIPHPSILLPPPQATEPARERSEGRERLFLPLSHSQRTRTPPLPSQGKPSPSHPCSPASSTGPKPSLQICHLHQLSPAHALATLLPSTPQNILLRGKSLKGGLGNGVRATP